MEGQDWMLDRTKVKEAKAVFSRKIMRGKITDEQHAIELFFMTPIFIQKNQKIAMRIKVEHQEKTAKVQYYCPKELQGLKAYLDFDPKVTEHGVVSPLPKLCNEHVY